LLPQRHSKTSFASAVIEQFRASMDWITLATSGAKCTEATAVVRVLVQLLLHLLYSSLISGPLMQHPPVTN